MEDRWPMSDALGLPRLAPERERRERYVHVVDADMWNSALGASSSLAEFERKAQMLMYVTHRAIFEGFYQHPWTPNSGRMLWMTQPAWPSTMWQIYSWTTIRRRRTTA